MAEVLVEIADLPARFAEMLQRVATGDVVLITENQVPRARLVATQPNGGKRRIPELHPGNFKPSPDFDEPLPEEFWLGGA
jgi:prevent-host-death family protein